MARELSCEDKSRNNNNMVSSGGFCYSEISPTSNSNQTIQTQFTTSQIQDFHDHHHHQNQPNNNNNNPEIFNLTTGMDMIGFSKSTSTASSMWKGFNNDKPSDHQFSTTTGISERTTSDHHHHHHQNLILGPDHHHHHHQQQQQQQQQNQSWQESNIRPFMVDESSLIFPCEGNERPSQGLSLTLSSNNPSTIGLQTFELRHTTNSQNIQQQLISQSPNLTLLQQQHGQVQLRNSKFLSPAQELLNEFCSLGTKQTDSQKQKSHRTKLQWELDQDNNDNNNGASSSKNHSLYSLEFMELQKRKTKLISMLEEVERRYKKYCDQMKAVVSSFEAVSGPGSAAVYSALASKAMSRHFRCLKDGIVAQIEATRKAMGEKDNVTAVTPTGVPGTTRGETPRLKVIDQAMRQHRAFQQMTMMESHPWRPQRGLPERSVSVLRAWLFEHFLHPYPSDVDKHILARQTGLSRSQVSNWFINARVRLWKPMVEEMYIEETKEEPLDGTNNTNMAGSSSEAVEIIGIVDPTTRPDHEQKPTPNQLLRIDSECLSSIETHPSDKPDPLMIRPGKALAQHHPMQNQLQRHQNFGRLPDSFTAMELDFSSYPAPALYDGEAGQGFIGGPGGGGVSLTLGLQQHAGTESQNHHHHGVSLAFSPGSQSSLFYPRSASDHNHHSNNIDDQYSLLDGDQGQNLPYRNLMGAQLLHDLA